MRSDGGTARGRDLRRYVAVVGAPILLWLLAAAFRPIGGDSPERDHGLRFLLDVLPWVAVPIGVGAVALWWLRSVGWARAIASACALVGGLLGFLGGVAIDASRKDLGEH